MKWDNIKHFDKMKIIKVTVYLRFLQTLVDVLKDSFEGKALLKRYKTIPLDVSARRTLTKIICSHILNEDLNKPVKTSTYVYWTQEIKKVFPKELTSVYFNRAYKESPQGMANRVIGKLPDMIHYLKRKARANGLFHSSRSSTPSSSSSITDEIEPTPGKRHSVINPTRTTDIDDADIQDSLQWLRHSSEPWQIAENKWQLTTSARLSRMLSADGPTIQEYFEDYKCLKKPLGYCLVSKSFLITVS